MPAEAAGSNAEIDAPEPSKNNVITGINAYASVNLDFDIDQTGDVLLPHKLVN